MNCIRCEPKFPGLHQGVGGLGGDKPLSAGGKKRLVVEGRAQVHARGITAKGACIGPRKRGEYPEKEKARELLTGGHGGQRRGKTPESDLRNPGGRGRCFEEA